MDDRPIGMFDSGFGGLTVARALIDLLPGEDLVYVGDTGRYPYGPKPLEEVSSYAHEIAGKLVHEHDVKMVVVACNTAAAAALHALRFALDVPVIGVIDPGLRSALKATMSGRIGVIGTVGTIASGAYQRALAELRPSKTIELPSAACPGFVEFVERGETRSDQVTVLAERLLAPVRAAQVDTLSRVHPLSVPRPDHQRRGGPRRRPRELGRRNRLRSSGHPRRDRAGPTSCQTRPSHVDLVRRRRGVPLSRETASRA
jgi:glutamate racemase